MLKMATPTQEKLSKILTEFGGLDRAHLWRSVSKCHYSDEVELFCLLKTLIVQSSSVSVSVFFPKQADETLMCILRKSHGPQVAILTCVLLAMLCNATSTQKNKLVKDGVVVCLLTYLGQDYASSTVASEQLRTLLYEKVTSFLLYISLGPKLCTDSLLVEEVVRMLVERSRSEVVCAYAPQAKRCLRDLTKDKVLVGIKKHLAPDKYRKKMKRYFGLGCTAVTSLLPVGFTLDLYDTSDPDEDVWVNSRMARSGYWRPLEGAACGWPSPEADVDWHDFVVTHVEDGGHLWVWLGSKQPRNSIAALQDTLRQPYLQGDSLQCQPKVGDVVGAFQSGIGVYRCVVLEASSRVTKVFAVDYGFRAAVPWRQLFACPPPLQASPPPLVAFCHLRGAGCPLRSHQILDNILAIFTNLAASVERRGALFADCGVVDLMCQVMRGPYASVSVVTRSLQCLANLAAAYGMRQSLGLRGLVQKALEVIADWKAGLEDAKGENLIRSSLHLLTNLLYCCRINKSRFQENRGPEVLLPLLRAGVPSSVTADVAKVFRVFTADAPARHKAKKTPPCGSRSASVTLHVERPPGDERRSLGSSDADSSDSVDMTSDSPGLTSDTPGLTSDTPDVTPTVRHSAGAATEQCKDNTPHPRGRGQDLLAALAQDAVATRPLSTRPVDMTSRVPKRQTIQGEARVAGQFEDCGSRHHGDDVPGACSAEHIPKDSECSAGDDLGLAQTVAGRPSLKVVNTAAVYAAETVTRYCVRGDPLGELNPDYTEIRENRTLRDISLETVRQLVCGLLNKGRGGSLYFGLQTTGHVLGIAATRDEKDMIRIGVDRMTDRLVPALPPATYHVHFHPVVEAATPTTPVPDLYVIEIRLEAAAGALYTLRDMSCYVRKGAETVVATMQDIQEKAVADEESVHMRMMEYLQSEVARLGRQHDGVSY